jgi:hypothetical protein
MVLCLPRIFLLRILSPQYCSFLQAGFHLVIDSALFWRPRRPVGRKPPLMAEVGQSIFHERIIGIVCFMEAKGLRGAAGLRVWHGNCSDISTRIPL